MGKAGFLSSSPTGGGVGSALLLLGKSESDEGDACWLQGAPFQREGEGILADPLDT